MIDEEQRDEERLREARPNIQVRKPYESSVLCHPISRYGPCTRRSDNDERRDTARHSLTYVLYPRLPLSSLSLRAAGGSDARVTNVERSDRSVAGRE